VRGITVGAELRGIGNKPLVLLASESITITGASGEVNVGSRHADADAGAGANPISCMAGTPPEANGQDGGGGVGGSFIGTGGSGGSGGGGRPLGGSPVGRIPNITTIRGGCPGQRAVAMAVVPAVGKGAAVVLSISSRRMRSTSAVAASMLAGKAESVARLSRRGVEVVVDREA
jgi:hypothetical protein